MRSWRSGVVMVAVAALFLGAAPAAAQTVSCTAESGSGGTNYVCTIDDCTSFDLNELAGLVGADGGTTIWLRAWGGNGAHGKGVAAADGGAEGKGGYAQTVTTVDDYAATFGTTLVWFYLGAQGDDNHPAGKGGASTIVAAADLATTPPCIVTSTSTCGAQNILLIAGGGGGGGQASSDGLYAGGAGGDGGVALAAQGSAGLGTGDASSGNYQGQDSAGGGGGGTAGSAPSSSGGGKAQDGIGGPGGEVHVSSGGSTPTGWTNQTPTEVGSMGQGGEGGHDDAEGGGGGGGYGGGGGGGAGGSLQGTGGGGGGSYAYAASQPTGDAPSSKPDNPSTNGVFQVVFQQVARTPAAPAATATPAGSATPTAGAAVGGVGVTATPTIAATATPEYFGDSTDLLNGQRVLADVVDLIVVNPVTSGGSTAVGTVLLDTANGAIVGPQVDAAVVSAPCAQSAAPRGNPFPQQSRGARLFDTAEDVVVTLAPTTSADANGCGGSDNLAFYVSDQLVPANSSTTTLSGAVSADNPMLAVADYNLDGYDDLLVLNATQAFVATASDTGTPSAGLVVGPTTAMASGTTPLGEPATGDFNGDGLIDVAWIGGTYGGALTSPAVYLATVCPGPVPGTICADATALTVLLDPLDAQPLALANPSTSCGGLQANAIAAGNFSGDVSVGLPNQLLTVTVDDACQAAATLYGFDGDFTATQLAGPTALPSAPGLTVSVTQTYATSAVLDVLSAATQGIVAYGGIATDSSGTVSTAQTVAVVSYDGVATLGASAVSVSDPDLPPLAGLAVGLFGAPPSDDATVADYTPQIAILIGNDCTGAAAVVNVYDVDPTSLAPALSSQFTLSGIVTPTWLGYVNLAGSLLQAGDLQGESIRVGQPVIMEVSTSMQPFVVLGAPPMHVDYVALDDDDDADVVNFSVLPTYFYSQFDTDIVGSNQSSTMSTTSYGHAVDLSMEEQVGFAFAPGFDISGTFSQSLQFTYERTVAKQYDDFASLDFDASTQTAFYDEVWYTAQSYTVYNYPVIGQTSCPADTTGTSCDPSYPLYVTLSGPTVSTLVNTQGAGLEWYQPVHEVGQVLSYPPNVTLLRQRLTNPSEPLSSAVAFDTDTSSAQESVSWSVSQSQSLTTGTSSTFSYELDNSVTGGTPLYNILQSGYQTTTTGDYENTTAQTTLNSSTTAIGASGGVTIVKSGLFLTPSLYAYQVEPFILAQTEPVPPDQTLALDTDIQTTGTLQTAFAADPTAGTGSWWTGATPYSSAPDVALNHPARWDYTAETLTDPPPACLQQTTDAAGGFLCLTMNDPDADDLWDSQFYWMRGLFITVGGTGGTQRNSAVVGDVVYLQARVYNYSLTDMPSGTDVHVRFYMQQWDSDAKTPIGDAILVNDADVVISGGIPPFNETTANWTTATTSFDTSDLEGDTTWVFWVVTWMQNGDDLVAEVPGHGLTAIPGTLTGIGDVPIETVSVTLPDGSTDDQVSFTNNVGFYNFEFALQSADTASALRAAARRAGTAGVAAAADALHVSLSRDRAAPGDKVVVRGRLTSAAGLPAGTFVYFYEAERHAAGRPFDVELLPPVRPGDDAVAQVPYRPQRCGPHEILVVAAQGQANELVGSAHLDVPCATPTPTPGGGHDDDGCQIPAGGPTDRRGGLLLATALAALAWRRRGRGA